MKSTQGMAFTTVQTAMCLVFRVANTQCGVVELRWDHFNTYHLVDEFSSKLYFQEHSNLISEVGRWCLDVHESRGISAPSTWVSDPFSMGVCVATCLLFMLCIGNYQQGLQRMYMRLVRLSTDFVFHTTYGFLWWYIRVDIFIKRIEISSLRCVHSWSKGMFVLRFNSSMATRPHCLLLRAGQHFRVGQERVRSHADVVEILQILQCKSLRCHIVVLSRFSRVGLCLTYFILVYYHNLGIVIITNSFPITWFSCGTCYKLGFGAVFLELMVQPGFDFYWLFLAFLIFWFVTLASLLCTEPIRVRPFQCSFF